MDVYAENILDHYRSPRGKGKTDNATVVHEEINHACGDAITVYVTIKDGVIEALSWDGTGCAISQAAMSMVTEEWIGQKTDVILSTSKDDIYNMLGVPIGPRRFKCALLCLHTLKNALRKAGGLETQSWLDTVEVAE